MKKIITLLLCAVMVIGIFAGCGDGASKKFDSFAVGYGNADITPTAPVPLAGYEDSLTRISTQVADPLNVSCIAFTDTEGQTLILFNYDLLGTQPEWAVPTREMVSEATGVPVTNIALTATHSHSAPDMSKPEAQNMAEYIQMVKDKSVEAAKAAMADRAPATMETGYSRPEGLTFSRHYISDTGEYWGTAKGYLASEHRIGHASQSDNLLQLARFVREGDDKKDIYLINWQGHGRKTTPVNPHTSVSSNYQGVMRETLQEQANCHVFFLLGASGNMGAYSEIDSDMRYVDYDKVGVELAKEVMALSENLTPSATGNIQVAEDELPARNNRWGGTLYSPLYAYSIGDLAFVTAPAETFSTNAITVKNASKFKMTMYASLAVSYSGYIPSAEAFTWGSNVYEVDVTHYPQGTGEEIATRQIALLDQIFATSGNAEVDHGDYTTVVAPTGTDGETYVNFGMAATEGQNGFYVMQLMCGTELKTILLKDKTVADKIAGLTTMQLVFDMHNVVIDAVA